MSIYIGNDLEDRLEALEMEKTSLKKYNSEDRLKALETENALLKKYNEYHQVVHEIDHMSDLHLDSSFHKQSMDIDKYFKIKKWYDSSIGQSTVIQQLDNKRHNKRRYVNCENGSHFICSFNLNNLELTLCIAFRMNNIASGNYPFLNSIIGNNNGNTARFIAFYRNNSGLGLLISNSYSSFVTVANDDRGFVPPNYKFPSSKSNCTLLNKWHIISVAWSNRKSNCWSNGEKIINDVFEILESSPPLFQYCLGSCLTYELTFADYSDVIKSMDPDATYTISNISLEFDTIINASLARQIRTEYMKSSILYDRILRASIIPLNNSDTSFSVDINSPSKSLKGVLLIFTKERSATKFTCNTEEFFNPKITKVEVTVEGVSNELYAQNMEYRHQYDEIVKHFAEGRLKEAGVSRRIFSCITSI